MSEPQSALLPLPRELRDCIYEYLFTTTFYVMNPRAGETCSSLPLHRPSYPAILNVSKSTYDEAKDLFYRCGHFHFNVVEAGAPPLHTRIGGIPALETLQDITIRVNTRIGGLLGYGQIEMIAFGTMLIRIFARLESEVQRKRCVVEIEFASALKFSALSLRILSDFKEAVSRLTGFKAVELNIRSLVL